MHFYFSYYKEHLIYFFYYYFFITCDNKFLYCLNLLLSQSSVADPHLSKSALEVPAITSLHTHSDAILCGQFKGRSNV